MRVTVAVVMRGACGVPCAQERASLPIGFGLGGVVDHEDFGGHVV